MGSGKLPERKAQLSDALPGGIARIVCGLNYTGWYPPYDIEQTSAIGSEKEMPSENWEGREYENNSLCVS